MRPATVQLVIVGLGLFSQSLATAMEEAADPYAQLESAWGNMEASLRRMAVLEADEVDQARKIAFDKKNDAKAARNSKCAFAVLQAANFLARSGFQIRAMAKACPKSVQEDFVAKKFVSARKTCLITTASFVTSLSQIAAGLAAASDACADKNNWGAKCAVPAAAIFTPASQFIAAPTVISAACGKTYARLPKDITIERRLRAVSETSEEEERRLAFVLAGDAWNPKPEDRAAQIGVCVIDTTSIAMAIGQMALGFNGATKNCPVLRTGTDLQQNVKQAACIVPVAFTFFSVARTMLFLSLSVEHCAPGNQVEALCVAGVAALTAATFSTISNGAALYLNCEIGKKKGDIIAGNWNKLYAADALGGRRLGEEVANTTAGFTNPDDLWLSLGYNMSDETAPWAKEEQSLASGEMAAKGEALVQELQTDREEPMAELLQVGPSDMMPSSMPAVAIDVSNEAETLSCSTRGTAFSLDLAGRDVSTVANIAACQARCAGIAGCAHFSYLPASRHCRVHGILTEPIPGQWISGPAGCQKDQVSQATARTIERKLSCYHPHATYYPMATLDKPVESVDDCQLRCQQVKGCAHFIYSEIDGKCSLAEVDAVKLQPVMFSLAGPRHCPDEASTYSEKFQVLIKGGLKMSSVRSVAVTCGVALCMITGLLSLVSAAFVASKRVWRRVAQGTEYKPAAEERELLAQ